MSKTQKTNTLKPGLNRNKPTGTPKRKISDVLSDAVSPSKEEKVKNVRENDKSPSDAKPTKDSKSKDNIDKPQTEAPPSTVTNQQQEKKAKREKIAPKPNLIGRKKNIADVKKSPTRTENQGVKCAQTMPHVVINLEQDPTKQTEGNPNHLEMRATVSSEVQVTAMQSASSITKPTVNLEQKILDALHEIEELKKSNNLLKAELMRLTKDEATHPTPRQLSQQEDSWQLESIPDVNIDTITNDNPNYGLDNHNNIPSDGPAEISNVWPTPDQHHKHCRRTANQQDELHPSENHNNNQQSRLLRDDQRSTEDTTPTDQSNNIKKVNKPPPIIAMNQPALVISNLMSCSLNLKNFHIKRIKHNKHIIFVENLDEYKQACEMMRERRIDFFTFTPKVDKIKTMVIKGIDGGFSTDDILTSLRETRVDDVDFISVSNFVTHNAKKLGRVLPIFLVKLSANSNISNLVKIKRILHQSVSWEPLKKSEKVQCKRCQRIGHVAKNCNLAYRCVKCEENHEPGQCKIVPSDNEADKAKLFCVHCQSHGHPASYRGCPKLVEYNKIIKKKIEETNDKKIAKIEKIANKVNPAISYSTITSNISPTDSQLVNTDNTPQAYSAVTSSAHLQNSDNLQLHAHLQKIQKAVDANANNIHKLFDLFNKILTDVNK